MTEAQTLKHIITSRKSVYPPEYSDTPIPEEVLQEIISSADEAPNHKRTKPWRLKVYKGGKVAEWEEIAATAMAVQNMYLTCTAHAVGCYWGTPGFMFQLKDFLQLEENERCYGLFFMGKKR